METGVKIALCVNALKAIDLPEICTFTYCIQQCHSFGKHTMDIACTVTDYRKTFQLCNISSFLVEISKKPVVG